MKFNPKIKAILRFTLVELLVVVAIIAVLFTLLMPALYNAKDYAVTIKCKNNQRQIGFAMMQYVEDYNGWGPAPSLGSAGGWRKWFVPLWSYSYPKKPYSLYTSIYQCPKKTMHPVWSPTGRCYCQNINLPLSTWYDAPPMMKRVFKPSNTLYLWESYDANYEYWEWGRGASPSTSTRHHNTRETGLRLSGQTNLLFCDGHAEGRFLKDIPSSGTFWTGR